METVFGLLFFVALFMFVAVFYLLPVAVNFVYFASDSFIHGLSIKELIEYTIFTFAPVINFALMMDWNSGFSWKARKFVKRVLEFQLIKSKTGQAVLDKDDVQG